MQLWPEISNGELKLGFVDAGGCRTRYIETGDGSSDEAVVFLHGTAGHLEAYMRNIYAHGAVFRTIALDLLGHGFSDKPDHDYEIPHYVSHLLAFCDSLGLRRIHLHGESMGGWIAAQFASEHPDRVASLTLNTAGGLNVDPQVMDRVYTLTKKAVAEASPETVRRRLEFLMLDPAQVTSDLVEMRLAIYQQKGFEKTIEHILCLQLMENRLRNLLTDETLASISAPTLVIWTDHDPTAPISVGERFARVIPDARLVVMSDCAHWPQWEKADEFNALHIDFLQSVTKKA